MPTIIDSLIVKLGLDSKELDTKTPASTKKLKDVEQQSDKTEKSVKKIGTASKETSRNFENLTRSLASFLALIGGTIAIKSFVSDTITANAALDRLAKNLGLNVSDVSAWGKAVEEVGGSARNLQGTLDTLSKAQTQLRLTGESSLIPFFARLGVNLGAFGQKVRPVDDILLDLSDRFSRMDRTQANNIGRMMGIDQDTLNLLLKGREAVELMIKRQKEHNAVTKQEAEQDVKWQRSIVDLTQSFNKFGRDLLQQAAPALEKLIGWFSQFGDWVHANGEFVKDFLIVMAVGLGAIALATLPINATAVAIVAVGAAIALLAQDYQTWKRGGNSFIDWGVWKHRVDEVTEAIKKLRDGLKDLDSFYQKMTGSKLSEQLKSGAKAILYGVGAAIGVKGLQNPQMPLTRAIAKQEGFYDHSKKTLNRAQRNHNPGDLEYGKFAREHGAIGSDGRFAIFPDDATGMAALNELLKSPSYANLSLEDKIKKFAPSSENNTAAYIAGVKKSLGMSAAPSLNGIQGASTSVAHAGTAASSSSTTNDHSKTVSTGDIKIYTAATDAQGIVKDFSKALNYLFTAQANSGLN